MKIHCRGAHLRPISQVNRLTRELSLLRQQTASVASTASSTSTGGPEQTEHRISHPISGYGHPIPARRHRSSSSMSVRSVNTSATTGTGSTGLSGSTLGLNTAITVPTVPAMAPVRDRASSQQRPSASRENSTVSSRRSEASSPSLASLQVDSFAMLQPHRQLLTSLPSQIHAVVPTSPGNPRSPSRTTTQSGSSRYEEATYHRAEMESARQENERLRTRVQELERAARVRQTSTPRQDQDG